MNHNALPGGSSSQYSVDMKVVRGTMVRLPNHSVTVPNAVAPPFPEQLSPQNCGKLIC